jgi:hypothetical protein
MCSLAAVALTILTAPLSDAIINAIPYHSFLPAYAVIRIVTTSATRHAID